MKKLLGFLMIMCLMLSMSSCNYSSQKEISTVDTIVVDSTIDVDHAIAIDRQTMYMKFGKNYRWFETGIVLPYFLDSDNVTSDPVMVVNVFQSIVEFDGGADTYVWEFKHFEDTLVIDSIHSFWTENNPLNEQVIKVNYAEAWNIMMSVNFKKPHSKYVTLRNPVGPVEVNTQWIFGNSEEQIWVDAVTGETSNSDPAFPDSLGFKMPLGEWP